MNFTLTTLGTASARPMVDRHQSACAFNLHGRLMLVDCGEGTQTQLSRYGISKSHLDNIFISHLHGDHVFGIFGLLSTMMLDGRTAPLYIYAPRDFSSVLHFFIGHFGDGLRFEINHIPLKMKDIEQIATFRTCTVSAFPLRHSIDCFGFRIDERLKAFIPADDEGKVPLPRSAAYCSDTMYFPELSKWVRGVDVLYHEATFADEHASLAPITHHSTARQAAAVALEAGAGQLIISHFSSRYNDFSILLNQAREVFPETSLAEEGKSFDIKTKHDFPVQEILPAQ